MFDETDVNEALAMLDSEVRAAGERVAEVERALASARANLDEVTARRRGADRFLSLVRIQAEGSSGDSSRGKEGEAEVPPAGPSPRKGQNTGLSQVISEVAKEFGAAPITIDAVLDDPRVATFALDREQVRNSLHYLTRTNFLARTEKRGRWRLVSASDAGLPGVPKSDSLSDAAEP